MHRVRLYPAAGGPERHHRPACGAAGALSPAFANVFGTVLLHERITGLGALGMALILGSILLPHLLPAGKNTAPAANKE